MTDWSTRRHAPLPPRLVTGVPILLVGVLVALIALTALGGLPGIVVAVVAGVLGVGTAAFCWGTSLVIDGDALVIRNPFRTRRMDSDEVTEIRPERIGGMVGPSGSVAGVVRPGGSVVRILASLSPGRHGRAELYLDLRRWSARHGVTDRLARQEYDDDGTRMELLEAGEEVEVTGQLRRTDSRGWGGWEEVRVRLPSPAAKGVDGARRPVAKWVLVQPPETALAGPARARALEVGSGAKAVLRKVRFPEEAFFGPATRFVVVTTMQHTVELALRAPEADPVMARLRALSFEPTVVASDVPAEPAEDPSPAVSGGDEAPWAPVDPPTTAET